ncbi:hypothetical protein [Streptomyces sp. NPDC059994]|uniref:hypothetical protein n=1 Tax=Streptomyces sp. NPDC059994 TaxID=3347029 RepID=UPI0036B88A00
METFVIVAAIILATVVGMGLIHLLNAQHDARIAAFHFSAPLPRPPGQPDDTGRRAHHTDADRRGTGAPPTGAASGAPRRPTR